MRQCTATAILEGFGIPLKSVFTVLRPCRCVIDNYLANANFLASARVLSERLNSPQESLQILARGWPCSAQAGGCLVEKFRLHGQLGEHETASQQILLLSDRQGGSDQAEALVKVLTKVAAEYPD